MSHLECKVLICRNIHHVADLEAKKCEFGDQQINDTTYLTTVEFEFKKMEQTWNLQIHSRPHMREVR